MSRRDWDTAFANMAHIPNSSELPAFWSERAAKYRNDAVTAQQRIDINIAYGEHDREVLDIVWPDSQPAGLLMFIHGGYWIRLDKSYWTDLAEGARASGWAVAIPSYTLAPEARISAITQQIGRAIGKAAELVLGPIRLAGHSAGGHLVTRMLCDDKLLATDIQKRIAHTVSISGLHDLRPLIHTEMNQSLQLDIAEATSESPVLHTTAAATSVTAWVGGGERPEFIRQAKLLHMIWDGLDAKINCVVDGTHNHFTVIEGLKKPDSALVKEILKNV